MKINRYCIKNFDKVFVIAEIGANHNGSFDIAKKMVDKAIKCGCHCVKFQSWSKNILFSNSLYKNNKTVEKQIDKYSFNLNLFKNIKKYCDKKGIIFSTSVFSEKEVDFFDKLNIAFFKIASMDLNNLQFIKYIAKKGRPIILSTGLASLSEISKAYEEIKKYNNQLALLHCVSLYPPKDEQVNLNNIDMLRANFDCPIGFSDHTIGTDIPIAAFAKGISILEKHFTLDKNLEGWDHKVSADPLEMKKIVKASKKVIKALGNYRKNLSPDELEKRKIFRRSIVSKRDLKSGQILNKKDLAFKRPGTGMEPNYINFILGRKLKKNLAKDSLITLKDLS